MLLPTSLSLSPCRKASVTEVYQPVLYLEIANEKFLYKVTTGPARGIIQNQSLPQWISTRHPRKGKIKREGERERKKEGCGGRWREEQEKQSEILFRELNGHNHCHRCLSLSRDQEHQGDSFINQKKIFCPIHILQIHPTLALGNMERHILRLQKKKYSQSNPN